MNNKKILIFGVGRSGTTAVYSVLQKVLAKYYPDDVDYVYEPFLWDRDRFNKTYTELDDDFSNISSVSIDGIYNHKKIPLFVKSVDYDSYKENEFVQSTVRSNNKSHILTKYIRGNGRIGLIRKIAPEAKVIFIIRNPLDVINSSINMFSYFGDDFYPSDFEKFKNEIKELYGDDLSSIENSRAAREFAYWFYMNRFFIDYISESNENILPIVYEEYVQNNEQHLKDICNFIDVDFSMAFVKEAGRKVGPIQSLTKHLTYEDYEYIRDHMSDYADMLSKLGSGFDIKNILAKYEGASFSIRNLEFEDKNSLYLKNLIPVIRQDYDSAIGDLQRIIQECNARYGELNREHHHILAQIHEICRIPGRKQPFKKYAAYRHLIEEFVKLLKNREAK